MITDSISAKQPAERAGEMPGDALLPPDREGFNER